MRVVRLNSWDVDPDFDHECDPEAPTERLYEVSDPERSFLSSFGSPSDFEDFPLEDLAFPGPDPSPLSTLPPELLGEIFLIVKDGYLNGLEYDTDRWVYLSHICQNWRQVSLATPLLWRDIQAIIPDQLEYLHMMLMRSSHAPLRLSLEACDGNETAKLLRSELHRVEDLRVNFHSDTTLSVDISSWTPPDAPLLKTLDVQAEMTPNWRAADGVIIETSFSDIHLLLSHDFSSPRLEYVQFRRFPYPSVSPYFRPTLKTLSLHHCKEILASELLRTISSMPLLEYITINDTLDDDPQTEASEYIELPHLKIIEIRNNGGRPTAHILDGLLFPSTTHLQISPGGRSEHTFTAIPALMSKATGQTLLNSTHPVTSLSVRSPCDDYDNAPNIDMWTCANVLGVYGSSNSLNIDAFKRDNTPFCTAFFSGDAGALLHTLCSLSPYPFTSLRTLHLSHLRSVIGGGPWCAENGLVYHWSSAFRSFTMLESLYLEGLLLDGLGSPHVLLSPYRTLTTDTPTPDLYENTTTTTITASLPLPFPRLRLLSFAHIRWNEIAIGHLHAMLQARFDAGLGLDTLILSSTLCLDSDDAGRLGEYAREFHWDGGLDAHPAFLRRLRKQVV
ncbi:hypothetical protein BXZ70DRAFT_501288 [Cristinia sonorae]|uniref:F-box domain-containing protein n=1 Tax=Cristinia sonorae TaxID=1940300 RepID=A0A8K0UGB0_9AGAR|nr:hypothetical protein BXZ70DRAFT_501288 [Cristinia sonorae]